MKMSIDDNVVYDTFQHGYMYVHCIAISLLQRIDFMKTLADKELRFITNYWI